MISKVVNKNLQYNLLSLLNVFIGFLFIVVLGRKFGVGKETDTYFLSVVVINYLGYFVQSVWEAMIPYYVEAKLESIKKASRLYSILLNDLVLVATSIIILYFMVIFIFSPINEELKKFLNIFIFYLLFQNILLLNKIVLNLEQFYFSYYLVDVFIFSVLLITVFISHSIKYIAFGAVLSVILVNIWQFYLIFKKVGLNYEFKLYSGEFKEIYINSFKLKLGSLFYGSKDIIIAFVFTSFGEGIYSLFSYASKFNSVILQIVNAPIVNLFVVKANYLVIKKKCSEIKKILEKTLFQTIPFFVLASIIVYFLLPFLLNVLLGEKLSTKEIETTQKIFLMMSLYGFIVVIESPFARLVSMFKLFNYGLMLNIIFFFLLVIGYVLVKFCKLNYIQFLFILVLAQISNLILAYLKYVFLMKREL